MDSFFGGYASSGCAILYGDDFARGNAIPVDKAPQRGKSEPPPLCLSGYVRYKQKKGE